MEKNQFKCTEKRMREVALYTAIFDRGSRCSLLLITVFLFLLSVTQVSPVPSVQKRDFHMSFICAFLIAVNKARICHRPCMAV